MEKTWPVWIGGMLGLAAIAFAFATQAGVVNQWHEAAHYTARVGFPLLDSRLRCKAAGRTNPQRVGEVHSGTAEILRSWLRRRAYNPLGGADHSD